MKAIRAVDRRVPLVTPYTLKRLLPLAAFLVAAGSIYPDPTFLLFLATVPVSIWVPSSFAKAEKADAFTPHAALPAGRNAVVLRWYASALVNFAAAITVAVIVAPVVAAARSLPFRLGAAANLFGASFLMFAVTIGILLPLCFANGGVRKLAIMSVDALVFFFFLWLVVPRFLQGGADATASPAIAAGELAVGFVILGVSTAISSRLYRGRPR